MTAFEIEVEIDQPPKVVEQALLDPGNAVFWTTDLEQFEVIARPPGKVGSLAHLHYNQGGQRYILKDELLEYTPQKYFRSRVTGNGLEAFVETWLVDLGGCTGVKVRWSGTADTFRMRMVLFIMKGAMRRQSQSEFEQFKTLVERYGSHFVQ